MIAVTNTSVSRFICRLCVCKEDGLWSHDVFYNTSHGESTPRNRQMTIPWCKMEAGHCSKGTFALPLSWESHLRTCKKAAGRSSNMEKECKIVIFLSVFPVFKESETTGFLILFLEKAYWENIVYYETPLLASGATLCSWSLCSCSSKWTSSRTQWDG